MNRSPFALFALAVAALTPAVLDAQTPAVAADDFVRPSPVVVAEPLASELRQLDTGTIAAHLGYLASPALAGRGLATPPLDAAAEYLAAQLRLAGIAPLGDTVPSGGSPSYFQELPLRRLEPASGTITVVRSSGETVTRRTFRSGVDLLLPAAASAELRGPVVDAGFGLREPALGRDDYRGLDVRGRLVLVRAGLPDGDAWHTPALTSRYDAADEEERDDAKLELARVLGAVALLVIEKDEFAPRLARGELAAEGAFAPFVDDGESPAPPRIRLSPAVATALLGDRASGKVVPPPGLLPGVSVELGIDSVEHTVMARNVLGVIPGSDPARRDEAVVLGAHYDHLGVRGGRIYPGADDNASGVAALLAIARTFAEAAQPPRRTLVFAFWTGEEEGHLGSRFYLGAPRWPLARTAVYLNLDMIGHPWLPEEIAKLVADAKVPDGKRFLESFAPADFVEPGVPNGRPELDAALRQAAAATGLTLHFDRTDGKHGGSDYRGFARRAIPFVRFFGNFFPGYHEPADRADALDVAQVQRVARLAFATARELANR